MKRSWLARHPIGFMALYTIFYLSVFHSLEANVPLRSILVHCRLDDLIPFCKYAVIPYFAWFLWIPFTLFYLLLPGGEADVFSTLPARILLMRRVPPDCALLVFAVCCMAACTLRSGIRQVEQKQMARNAGGCCINSKTLL